jgi:hypothetical protein
MQKLFEKNIKFFYENLPQYYELIKNIRTRNYKITKDNIYNIYTNTPLYPNDIHTDSKTFAAYPTHNQLWEKKFFYITPYKWEDNFYVTGNIINKLINTAIKDKTYMKEGFYFDKDFLPTTVIFGLLGGKHLDLLVKKYEFQSLFVYEPNPEFFALSLYFVDYPYIYEKLNDRFFLWVNGKVDYFAIEKFYYERRTTSSFFQLSLTTYNHSLIDDAKSKFNETYYSKLRGWGTYEDEIVGIKNHLKNLNKFLTLKPIRKNLNIPICVVANGKSLEKNMDFIKKNKDSMIIVSVGTALKPLLKEGIHSDFHIEQERIPNLPEILKDTLPKFNGHFLGASVVNPDVFKLAKNPLMYFREGFTLSPTLYILKGSSPIVGNSGVAFSAVFSNEIYLCGMDLGYRLGERKHTKNSFYDNLDDTATNGIKIKGNFSDDIYTDSMLLSSKQNLEKLIKILNLKVYNLSDGAFIEGSFPLKDKLLPKIDKEKYIKKILNSFEKTSFSYPKLNLFKVLKPIKEVLKKEVKNYKELTGLIDFIDDAFDNSFYKSMEYSILKGSITHILHNLYILSHKIDMKNYQKLSRQITKNIYDFDKNFKQIYPF